MDSYSTADTVVKEKKTGRWEIMSLVPGPSPMPVYCPVISFRHWKCVLAAWHGRSPGVLHG